METMAMYREMDAGARTTASDLRPGRSWGWGNGDRRITIVHRSVTEWAVICGWRTPESDADDPGSVSSPVGKHLRGAHAWWVAYFGDRATALDAASAASATAVGVVPPVPATAVRVDRGDTRR